MWTAVMVPIITVRMNLTTMVHVGAAGSVVRPAILYKVHLDQRRSRWRRATNELRAIDYIIYHGATASQEKDIVWIRDGRHEPSRGLH